MVWGVRQSSPHSSCLRKHLTLEEPGSSHQYSTGWYTAQSGTAWQGMA